MFTLNTYPNISTVITIGAVANTTVGMIEGDEADQIKRLRK
jgi:hypothetical protein